MDRRCQCRGREISGCTNAQTSGHGEGVEFGFAYFFDAVHYISRCPVVDAFPNAVYEMVVDPVLFTKEIKRNHEEQLAGFLFVLFGDRGAYIQRKDSDRVAAAAIVQ